MKTPTVNYQTDSAPQQAELFRINFERFKISMNVHGLT
jgi:hypothetical protein